MPARSPLMSWADYGPREIHSAVASAVTLMSQSYMTFQWRSTDGLFMVRVCSFRYGGFVRFFSFCLCCLQDWCSFSSFVGCMRTVFPSHFSSLIKPSSLNGRREKKEILIPLLVQRKWEKEYRLFHLSLSLSSLRNYSEPFPPLEKIHTMPQYRHLLLRLLLP